MNKKTLVTLAALVSAAITLTAQTPPIHLACETLANPLGVDVARPRLSWQLSGSSRGEVQTAWRVLVASSSETLAAGQGDVWDSGKVVSGQSSQVEYAGPALAAARPYWWKVQFWDRAGTAGAWSEPATFTTGLFAKSDWQAAQWIAFRPEDQWRRQWEQMEKAEVKGIVKSMNTFPWLTGQGFTIWEHYAAASPAYDPSPLFRREFTVKQSVRRATMFICGLGYCEAFLNGRKIGDEVLDPAWTCYQKRALYVTHDVTAQVQTGTNVLGAMLGRGQFSPLCNDIWGLRQSPWVDQPRLIARLNLVYADGTTDDIVTDPSWHVAGGPILYDDTRHGELYDARHEQPGWNMSGFDDRAWSSACPVDATNPLQAQLLPPIREFATLSPVRRIEHSPLETYYDVGIDMSGWARVTVHGAAATRVLVDYAEVPYASELRGHLPAGKPAAALAHPDDDFRDLCNHVRQQNGYVLKGGGPETFTCHFSYKGFQFIRVAADAGVVVDRVEAVPVHSDVASAGDFECSNPMINRIQAASRLTFLNNLHSIQTDCPHREKQGWTADLYLTAEAIMYNFDMAQFYAKCATDISDTQNREGGLAVVAPRASEPNSTSTVWPAAMVCLPADLLTFYGDRRTTVQLYDSMKRFAQSSLLHQVPGKTEIITDVLGDWASPLDMPSASGETSVMSPPEGRTLYGTAAHYRVVSTLANLARALGKDEEAAGFDAWAGRIAAAFNREFLDDKLNAYHGERPAGYREAANAVPLDYGLVPPAARAGVLAGLVENLHVTRHDRPNTGFVGTPSLLNVLAETSPEVAYALATQTNYPGWGWMINSGATTIYEQFGGDHSHDHPMFGCISAYFYKYLAGIQPDPAAPGFAHFSIHPSIVGDLTWVRAHYDSPHGRIVSNWERKGGRLIMSITVPANTTATVYVPSLPGKRAVGTEGLTESGRPLDNSPGIRVLETGNDGTMLAVVAGSYEFARN